MNFKDKKQDFKEFWIAAPFWAVPQMPQMTYSFIGDLLDKKFEIC